MANVNNFVNYLKSDDDDFSPYYEKENGFKRLSKIYSIVAFLIAPIFSFFVYQSNISLIYFYIGIGTSVLFPIYILVCYFVKKLNTKLIYFFIFHVFGITLVAFIDLVENNFENSHLFSFFAVFSISIFVLQRQYPTFIYSIYSIGLLIFGFQFVDEIALSKISVITLFGTLGLISIVVMTSRQRMINSVEDFSDYLKKIMQNPGIGYILISSDKEVLKVVDYNKEAFRLLKTMSLSENDIEKLIFTHFSKHELDQIALLPLQEDFSKLIVTDDSCSIEIVFTNLALKNGIFRLARLTDVTKRIKEKEELILREEKYRNLYYKNQAGVFTLDEKGVLIDFNEAFYTMFEANFEKGDSFVQRGDQEEWEDLFDIISTKQNLKNYQTHITLSSGKVKWYIFNYFFDTKTNMIEGTVVDVTNVQKASIALSQSEEKYRLIYEESNDAILLLEEDRIIDVNRKGIQLFGIMFEELIEKSLWSLSNDTSEVSEIEYSKIIKKLNLSRSIKFNWTFKGTLHPIEAEVAIIELMIGEQLFHQCVINDVSLKNATMRALEESKKSFQSILDNNPEGMIIACNNEILYTNKEAYSIIKTQKIALNSLFIDEDQQTFDSLFKQQQSGSTIHQSQLRIKIASIEPLLVDVTLVNTKFSEKDAVLIILKDISLQTKLSKEVLRAEIAEETNKKLENEISNRIKVERELENLLLKTKAIYDSSENTFLLTLDLQNKVTSFNRHFDAYFFHFTHHHIVNGDKITDYFKEIYKDRELRYFEKMLFKVSTGISRQIETKFMFNQQMVWLELFINPIFDSEGNISEISLVAHDITEKKIAEKEIFDSLKEKEVLLKEIHHRVKNNLQVISSILNLQSSFIQDDKMLDLLQESRNRIRSMAIIHEDLYRTTNFSSIDFAGYILNLATNLVSLYRLSEEKVELQYDLESIDLVLDQAVPCGLLVNELIANAIKYAFPNNSKGIIYIGLKKVEGIVHLTIKDNGVGLPKDFKIETSDTLGLQLVLTLVEQLDGEMVLTSKEGTEFLIKFEKT